MDSRILPFLRALVACLIKRSHDLVVARDLGHASLLTSFSFIGLVSLTISPHAKFEVCVLSRSREIIIIIIICFNDKLTSATHYNTKYRSNNVKLIVNKWKHNSNTYEFFIPNKVLNISICWYPFSVITYRRQTFKNDPVFLGTRYTCRHCSFQFHDDALILVSASVCKNIMDLPTVRESVNRKANAQRCAVQ